MRMVFVATEFDPIVPGGAGTVVRMLSDSLRSEGFDVGVVLVTDQRPPSLPPFVTHASPDPTETRTVGPFIAGSRAAARALEGLAQPHGIDLVEFQDFDALAYWSLVERPQSGLDRARLAVRMHGPADLMFEVIGVVPDDIAPVRVMEAEVYRMADVVIAPSEEMRRLLLDRYQLESDRVVVGVPPVPAVEPVPLNPAPHPEIVYFGRLAEVKGAHDFVDAVVPVLRRHPEAVARLIGPDGWSASAKKPMREWLESQIPPTLANRFRFEGSIDRGHLAPALASAWMVVLPSRFESFSLAAHEVRGLGLPVVLPDLPAFRGLFGEETGALLHEPSVGALEAAIERLVGEEPLRARLTTAAPPRLGDPLSVYRSDLPQPRHLRSQAGLATAAVKRLEALSTVARRPSGLSRIMQGVYRILPRPIARVAIRLVPSAVKDRLRPVANWGEEVGRRDKEERLAAVQVRIARGEFPELDEPLVSIIIPCFDHGAYLEEALASVFEQTFPYFEVIVVDDGSEDPATIAVLDSLQWPRTRVIRQENRGLPAARNAGMRVARAPYVVPLDADDQLAPDFLAELVNAIDRKPEAALAHCWAELFDEIHALFITRPFNPYQLLLSNPIIGCAVIRRSAWEEVGGYDETMLGGHEDWELWIRLFKAGWTETGVRRALFRYRKHGVSMSVLSEARFEQGRSEIMSRHPDLYEFAAMTELKREWYPLVSIISTPDQMAAISRWQIDDAELVAIGDDYLSAALASQKGWGCQGPVETLQQAVATARGKFLVVSYAVEKLDPGAISRMAEALEDEPQAAGAGPTGSHSPVVWRHWTVVDRAAPHRAVLEVDMTAVVSDDVLAMGLFPKPGWDIQDDLEAMELDLPIQRQPPEEIGMMPRWVSRR